MSAYTSKSVKRAVDSMEAQDLLSVAEGVGWAQVYGVSRLVPGLRVWAKNVDDELTTRVENEYMADLAPWSRRL